MAVFVLMLITKIFIHTRSTGVFIYLATFTNAEELRGASSSPVSRAEFLSRHRFVLAQLAELLAAMPPTQPI